MATNFNQRTSLQLTGTCPTKARTVKTLQESWDDIITTLRKLGNCLDVNPTEFIVTFLEHASEHYSELVFTRA